METVAPVSAPLVMSPTQTTQRNEHYKSDCVMGLSGVQIGIGTLCILLQCALIGLQSETYFIGHGIWAGSFFVLSGVVGIASSKRKTIALILMFLTLAIISAALTLGILTFSSMDIFGSMFRPYNEAPSRLDTIFAINAVMLIFAITEAVVAIISSALGCHGACSGNENQPAVVAGQVQYIQGPNGQQQMVILPLDQLAPGPAAGCTSAPDQTDPPPYIQDSPPPTYTECETKLPIPD